MKDTFKQLCRSISTEATKGKLRGFTHYFKNVLFHGLGHKMKSRAEGRVQDGRGQREALLGKEGKECRQEQS